MRRRSPLFTLLSLAIAACSLLAPSDEELGGGSDAGSGGESATGGGGGDSGDGGSGGGGGSGCPEGYADGDLDASNGCTEVPSDGLKFWFAGDDPTPSAIGLRQWVDRSGSNRDAFQDDLPSRPTVMAQSLNGLGVVHFDGIDDNLGILSGFGDLDSGITFAVVARRNVASIYATLLDMKDSTSGEGRFFSRFTGNDTFVYGGTGADVISPAGTFAADVPVLFVVVHEPARARLRSCQNELEVPNTNPTGIFHDSIVIGTNRGDPARNYTGDIAEIMFYSRPLDDADLNRLESYLIDKWQVCQ